MCSVTHLEEEPKRHQGYYYSSLLISQIYSPGMGEPIQIRRELIQTIAQNLSS